MWWLDIYALCREGWFSDNYAALLVTGNTLFFGQMYGLVEFRFELDLVVYMTCRCLRSYQFLICVS